MRNCFADEVQVVPAFITKDIHGQANPGDWVSLKKYSKCTVLFVAGVGLAGQDPVLTFQQATAVAGTNAKDLTKITRIDIKAGADLAVIGTYTKVTQAAAATYTNATHGELQKLYLIDIYADDLDRDNNFDCIQCSIADVGLNAQLGALLYLLQGPRYAPPLTAITDA